MIQNVAAQISFLHSHPFKFQLIGMSGPTCLVDKVRPYFGPALGPHPQGILSLQVNVNMSRSQSPPCASII